MGTRVGRVKLSGDTCGQGEAEWRHTCEVSKGAEAGLLCTLWIHVLHTL